MCIRVCNGFVGDVVHEVPVRSNTILWMGEFFVAQGSIVGGQNEAPQMATMPFRWDCDQCHFIPLKSVPVRKARYIFLQSVREAIHNIFHKISLVET